MQTHSNRYTPQKPQSQAMSMRPPLLASKPDQVTSPKLVFEDPGDRERPTAKKKVSIFGDDGLKPGNSNSDYNKKAEQVEKVLDAINFDFSSGKKDRPNLMLSGSKNAGYSQDSRLGFGSSLRNTANSTNPISMNSFEPQAAAYPNRSGSRLPPQPESEREMPIPRPQSNSQTALQSMKFQNQMRQPDGLRSPERSLDLGSNGQFQENLGMPMGGQGPQNPNLNIYQQNAGLSRPNHIAQQPQSQMNMMQQRPLQGSHNDSSNGMTQSNPYGLVPAGGMNFPPRQGQFQTPISDSGVGSGPMNPAALTRLDREFQELRAACTRKEQELRVLQAIADGQMPSGGPSVQLPSKDTLEKCIQASIQLKRQEAELRDLRFNYTMLKEETERQELEIRRARDMDGIDRIPRTQDELIKQNNVLRQKINNINQEYEKTIYDKTLEIEKKARTKMHKIALQIARKQVNPEDQEMKDLIAKATELEREYERLERENNPNEMSFVGIAN